MFFICRNNICVTQDDKASNWPWPECHQDICNFVVIIMSLIWHQFNTLLIFDQILLRSSYNWRNVAATFFSSGGVGIVTFQISDCRDAHTRTCCLIMLLRSNTRRSPLASMRSETHANRPAWPWSLLIQQASDISIWLMRPWGLRHHIETTKLRSRLLAFRSLS
jgi:hypothetical protein